MICSREGKDEKMKKKYGVIAILIAIVVLGVGYAVISNVTLNVSGSQATVNADQSNFVVKFDEESTFGYSGNPVGSTVTVERTNDTTATFTVEGLTKEGDKVTITYPIVNASETLKASLGEPSITNDNSEFFSVTSVSPTAGTELAANGGSANLVLVVEVIKTPVVDDETANITASVVASPVQ